MFCRTQLSCYDFLWNLALQKYCFSRGLSRCTCGGLWKTLCFVVLSSLINPRPTLGLCRNLALPRYCFFLETITPSTWPSPPAWAGRFHWKRPSRRDLWTTWPADETMHKNGRASGLWSKTPERSPRSASRYFRRCLGGLLLPNTLDSSPTGLHPSLQIWYASSRGQTRRVRHTAWTLGETKDGSQHAPPQMPVKGGTRYPMHAHLFDTAPQTNKEKQPSLFRQNLILS